VVTENVRRLQRKASPRVLRAHSRAENKWSGDEYAEFVTGAGVLAIFSFHAQEKYIPGSAEAAKDWSIILEFEVVDVDAEYHCLQTLVKTRVKRPTTQPLGTRSIYFRDPDGNLVDSYSLVPAS
jgi:catechol 2,3-dioxygenase-like lactoylglutathione lyase family enzyme